MEQDEFQTLSKKAAELVEASNHPAALQILERLVESDLAPADKSIVCVNLATVNDKMNRRDKALHWFDRAVSYERPEGLFFAESRKGAYLADIGHLKESLRTFEVLIARPEITEADQRSFRHNIEHLKDLLNMQAMGPLVVTPPTARIYLAIGIVILLGDALLWMAHNAGFQPPAPSMSLYATLGICGAIGLFLLVGSICERRQRYEVDSLYLRHRGVFRTHEIPVRDITNVTWHNAFGVIPGQVGLFPIPQILVLSHGKCVLRFGILPSASQRKDLARLVQRLARLNPAIQIDHAVRDTLGLTG